jgi:multimeric flavodoxin WrbA
MNENHRPYILGINGSPFTDGVVCELLNAVLKGTVEEGAETKIINLYELVSVYNPGTYSKNRSEDTILNAPPDDITKLYPEIQRADGLVFATPVYWASMSARMKDFIEHLTPFENDGFVLQGKVAAFIAASKENEGGVEMAAMSMVTPIAQMGVLIPPNAIMWHPSLWSNTKDEKIPWAKEGAVGVGKNMVKIIQLLKSASIDWNG